jgi:hypothetical protein
MVQRFARYHKYTVGTDLRQQAMGIMRGVHRAVYDRAQQARHVQALVWAVYEYKLTLQLAMEVGAFVVGKVSSALPSGARFAAFELALNLVIAIGKQCGGWVKAGVIAINGRVGKVSSCPPSQPAKDGGQNKTLLPTLQNPSKQATVGRTPTRHGGMEQRVVSRADDGRPLNNRPALNRFKKIDTVPVRAVLVGRLRGALLRAGPASLSVCTAWLAYVRLGYVLAFALAMPPYRTGWTAALQACRLAWAIVLHRLQVERKAQTIAQAQPLVAVCGQFKQRLERQFQQWQRQQQQPQQYQPCAASALEFARQWSAKW